MVGITADRLFETRLEILLWWFCPRQSVLSPTNYLECFGVYLFFFRKADMCGSIFQSRKTYSQCIYLIFGQQYWFRGGENDFWTFTGPIHRTSGQHMDSCIYEPELLYKLWLHKLIACWHIIAGLWRAKRACRAPWVSKSTHARKFGNHVPVHRPPARSLPVRPHYRDTNAKFGVVYESEVFFGAKMNGHPRFVKRKQPSNSEVNSKQKNLSYRLM